MIHKKNEYTLYQIELMSQHFNALGLAMQEFVVLNI